ncbi:hypothetical protein [Flavobacterium microcysteis]
MNNYIKLLSALSLFILISCEFSNKIPQPKETPKIPETAFLIKGTDGGNWYNIEHMHSHRNMVHISIYSDKTQELIVSKRFIIICQKDNMHFIQDLKEEIVSFDGKHIQLKNGCYLQ